jgi:oligopeptide transport system substrate-binding protein
MKKTLYYYLFLTVFIISCGPPEQDEDTFKTVFKYNEPGGITSLDPAFSRNIENIWPITQLFNGLVQMNADMQIEPCIAESWRISDDGKIYTFKLRNDVFFQDNEVFKEGKGRKVVAQDFVYSFWRIIDENTASPGTYIFNNLDKSDENNYMGFIAEDETTLKIYLKQPFPPFLGLLSMAYCSVVPKEAVEFYGNDFRRNPVGTGPFMLKNWKEGVKLIMIKNDNYFEKENGAKLPYLDAVSISFVKDPQVAFLDFIRGNYDFKSGLDATYKDEILTKDGNLNEAYEGKFIMQKQPWLETIYLGVLIDNQSNDKTNPLKEKAIRQAINYGFDREKMVKYLRNNIGKPATSGFIPFGMPSFNETVVKGYKYNPEKAKELLFLAGYPEGKNMPKITLATTSMYLFLCEYIQHELSDLGFNVGVEVFDEAAFREMVAQSKLPIFNKSWIADYPDAENFLTLFHSESFSPKGPNYTHFKNYEYDKLYEKAMNEVNDSLRFKIYQEMDKIIIENAPIIPLYYNEVVRFIQKDVKGLELNAMNMLILKRVKK